MPLIDYRFRNKQGRVDAEALAPFSLPDAVSLYAPDLDLSLLIGERRIPLEAKRDMYGLHSDLLDLARKLAFGLPSEGDWEVYLAAVRPLLPGSMPHLLVLTDFWEPPIIYFLVQGDTVSLQTRTFRNSKVVATDDDVTQPVVLNKWELIANIHAFLTDYLDGLLLTFPSIESLEDVHAYRTALREMGDSLRPPSVEGDRLPKAPEGPVTPRTS